MSGVKTQQPGEVEAGSGIFKEEKQEIWCG